MSNADGARDGLRLHLPLVDLDEGVTGNAVDGDAPAAVRGARLVPDDLFGACLELHADDAAVRASLDAPGSARTRCLWFRTRRADGRLLGVVADGGALDPLELREGDLAAGDGLRTHSLALADGGWHHLAHAVDGEGAQVLYLDGVPQARSDGGRPDPGGHGTLVLGGDGADGADGADGVAPFRGMLAHLRVYDRALSPQEVGRVMAADRLELPAFRRSHPLDVALYDDDDQYALTISDDPNGRNLNLELRNASSRAVEFLPGDGERAAPGDHHLELRFRSGTLAAGTLARLAGEGAAAVLPAPEWSLAFSDATRARGWVSLYLRYDGDRRTLAPGEARVVTLHHIAAAAAGGARQTRVELAPARLVFAGGGERIRSTRTQSLHVTNHSGRKRLPLHAGFVGSNRILNDAGGGPGSGTESSLALRLTNVIEPGREHTGADRIALPAGADADTPPARFTLAFEVQRPGEEKPWALCTEAEEESIRELTAAAVLHPPDGAPPTRTPLAVREAAAGQGRSRAWTLTPDPGSGPLALAPGDYLEIALHGIRSSLPAGHAQLYLHYEHIPGYAEGRFVCGIEKAPLLFRHSRVGIGTSEPAAHLHLRAATGPVELLIEADPDNVNEAHQPRITLAQDGGAVRGQLGFFDPGVNSLVLKNTYTGAFHGHLHLGTNDEERLTIRQDGRVGIGTTEPEAQLHVSAATGPVELLIEADPANADEAHQPRITLAQDGGAVRGQLGFFESGNALTLKNVDANALHLGTADRDRLTIDGSGRVGIGTTNPRAQLHVSGGAGSVELLLEADTDDVNEGDQPRITLSQDAGQVRAQLGYFDGTNDLTLTNRYTGDFGGHLHLGTGDATRLTIRRDGNVHVGADATTRLTIRQDGDVHIGGKKPMHFELYRLPKATLPFVDTGMRTSEWMAWIAGFDGQTDNTDVEGVRVVMAKVGGNWWVVGNFAGTSDEQTWAVAVVFVRNELISTGEEWPTIPGL